MEGPCVYVRNESLVLTITATIYNQTRGFFFNSSERVSDLVEVAPGQTAKLQASLHSLSLFVAFCKAENRAVDLFYYEIGGGDPTSEDAPLQCWLEKGVAEHKAPRRVPVKNAGCRPVNVSVWQADASISSVVTVAPSTCVEVAFSCDRYADVNLQVEEQGEEQGENLDTAKPKAVSKIMRRKLGFLPFYSVAIVIPPVQTVGINEKGNWL